MPGRGRGAVLTLLAATASPCGETAVTPIAPLSRIRSRTTEPCSSSNQRERSDFRDQDLRDVVLARIVQDGLRRYRVPAAIADSPPSRCANRKRIGDTVLFDFTEGGMPRAFDIERGPFGLERRRPLGAPGAPVRRKKDVR